MISMSLNRLNTKAIVHKDGTWVFVKGEIKSAGILVYLLNGRMEISKEGYYRVLNDKAPDESCQLEAERLNIHQYTRLARPGQRR